MIEPAKTGMRAARRGAGCYAPTAAVSPPSSRLSAAPRSSWASWGAWAARLGARVLLAAALAGGWCGDAPAQPPDARGPRVMEVVPPLLYLQDDGGRLVPVPGFRYRDFVDLLRLKEGLPSLPVKPEAVLEAVVVTGRLPETSAAAGGSCAVTVHLSVRQTRGGWVQLPLEFGRLILSAAPQYEGAGRCVLEGIQTPAGAEPDQARQNAGYRGWFHGTEDARHSVTLQGSLAVDASPASQSLLVHMPPATASRLELSSSRAHPAVSIEPRNLLPQIAPATDGTGSVITCEGLSGVTQVRVGDRSDGLTSGGAAPQAMVESLVRIDGRMAFVEATVRLENLSRDTTQLRLWLPPGCMLTGVREPAVLVSAAGQEEPPEIADGAERNEATRQLIVVEIGPRPEGRSTVEISCERPVDPTGRTAFDPGGFAVEGVTSWRQRGRISCVVEGEWQLEWDDALANRRVDPPAAARSPGFVAAFAYDAQPASLPLRVRPRASRVVIEPEYRYSVGTTRLSLDVKLRVCVRGAPVSRVVVGMEGFAIDEVGPASLVDTASLSGEGGELVIPLLQPLSGDATLTIRGSRAIERSTLRLKWSLPAPRADIVGPAAVAVTADSDIEVLPDNDQMRGLVRQVAPAVRRGDGDRGLLLYRLDESEGVFAATRRFLSRSVEAAVAVAASVNGTDTVVEETIRLDVAHVPLEYIDLHVPEAVALAGTLEVRQGGQVLNPVPLPSGGGPPLGVPGGGAIVADNADDDSPPRDQAGASIAAAAERGVLRSLLPVPLLGVGEIVLRFALPITTVTPDATSQLALPLVMPRGARVTRQTLALSTQQSLAVEVRGESWKRDPTVAGGGMSRSWTAVKPQESILLALAARQHSFASDLVVEAAWLETRLLRDRQEDVWSYALSGSGRRLKVQLPPGCVTLPATRQAAESVAVWVDGRALADAVQPNGTVVIDLPAALAADGGRGAWLVRIEATRPTGTGLWGLFGAVGPVQLSAPLFPDGTLQRRFYWDVRLAADEHVVAAPHHWTAQQTWEWGSRGLERVPVVSRMVLADWMMASAAQAGETRSADAPAGGMPLAGAPLPGLPLEIPLAQRRAVFSGVGAPGAERLWLMPSWLVVLLVSGPVVGVGLLLLYRPALRRVPVVLGLAAAAALGAAAAPDLAPLVIQATLPGVGLVLLAAGLRLALDQPRPAENQRRVPRLPQAEDSTQLIEAPSLLIGGDRSASTGSPATVSGAAVERFFP